MPYVCTGSSTESRTETLNGLTVFSWTSLFNTHTHDSWQIQTLVRRGAWRRKNSNFTNRCSSVSEITVLWGSRHRDRLAEQESHNVTLTQYIRRIPFVTASERYENWPMACVFWVTWKQSSERNEKSVIFPLAVSLLGIVASTRKGWPTTAKLSLELYWLLFAWNSALYLVTRIGSSHWKRTCETSTCFHLLECV